MLTEITFSFLYLSATGKEPHDNGRCNKPLTAELGMLSGDAM